MADTNIVLELRMLAEDLVKRCNALWLQRGPPNDNYRDLAETCRKALTTVVFSAYGASPLMFTVLKSGVAKYETIVPRSNNDNNDNNDNVNFEQDNKWLLIDESMTNIASAPSSVIDIINAGSVSYIADTLHEIEELVAAEEIGHAADVEDRNARENAYRDCIVAHAQAQQYTHIHKYDRLGDIDSDDDWEDPDEDQDVYADLATTWKAKQIRCKVYEATLNGCSTVDIMNRFYKYATVPWFSDSEREEDGMPTFFIQTLDDGSSSGLRIEEDYRVVPPQWCVRLAHRNCTLYKSYAHARSMIFGKRGRVVLDSGWEITWRLQGGNTMIEQVSFTEKSGERWVLNVPVSMQMC